MVSGDRNACEMARMDLREGGGREDPIQSKCIRRRFRCCFLTEEFDLIEFDEIKDGDLAPHEYKLFIYRRQIDSRFYCFKRFSEVMMVGLKTTLTFDSALQPDLQSCRTKDLYYGRRSH